MYNDTSYWFKGNFILSIFDQWQKLWSERVKFKTIPMVSKASWCSQNCGHIKCTKLGHKTKIWRSEHATVYEVQAKRPCVRLPPLSFRCLTAKQKRTFRIISISIKLCSNMNLERSVSVLIYNFTCHYSRPMPGRIFLWSYLLDIWNNRMSLSAFGIATLLQFRWQISNGPDWTYHQEGTCSWDSWR